MLVTGSKGGQNNLLYLPLDKMIDSGRSGSAPVTGAASAASNEANARAAADHMQQQQQTRSRETR